MCFSGVCSLINFNIKKGGKVFRNEGTSTMNCIRCYINIGKSAMIQYFCLDYMYLCMLSIHIIVYSMQHMYDLTYPSHPYSVAPLYTIMHEISVQHYTYYPNKCMLLFEVM